MAVTAQAGIFGFGGQSGKGTLASTFYRHRAADVDLSAISDDRLGPPEVGGIPTPTIPYRAGILVSGGATINPRLEDTIGWLLHGTMGAWSSTSDEDVFGNTDTGVEHHVFTFSTEASFVPYMSFRKYIPGSTSSNDLGETFKDCKIVSLALALPNDGLISSRVDVLGREPAFDDDPSFSWDNEFEDYESIPIGCTIGGYLKVPNYSATALPVTAANVTLTNAPLDIRQERNFGSPYLDEITVVGRSLTVDMVVKWNDPELYLSILTGTTTGTEWTSAPFTEDLDIYALSPEVISGQSTPYQLRVQATSVMYQVVGGIRLAGNNAVMMRVTGTAIAPSSGEYAQIDIANEATDYTWPT
jgi:hypothetical protein